MSVIDKARSRKKPKEDEAQVPGYDIFYNHKRKLWAILGSLMAAMLLSALDQMIFSTALPTIVGELGGVEHMLWVTTAYLLTASLILLVVGKTSDLLGRRTLLLISIGVFLVGSVIGGLSQDMITLIAARAIQGAGGGGLMLLSMSTIADVIPLSKRPKYMGMLGGIFGLSSILGPVLGGFFTDGPGWRWAFWMNVPLALIAIGLVYTFLRVPFERIKAKFDVWGTITMIVSVSSLILVTSWGGSQYDWNSPQIIGLVIAFAVFTALFILAESKASEPLVPLHLFKKRNFVISATAGLLVGIVMFSALSYLPTILQIVHSLGATNSGLLLTPMMAGLILMSVLSGQIISRTGNYKFFPIAGFAVIAVALFLFSTLTPQTSLFVSSVYLFLLGLGIGSSMQTLVLLIQQSAPKQIGVATGVNTFFREIGASLGAGFAGAIFSHNLASNLAQNLPASMTSGKTTNSLTPAIIDGLPTAIRTIIISAYNSSITPVFAYLIPVALLGMVLLFFVKQNPIVDNKVVTEAIRIVVEAEEEQTHNRSKDDTGEEDADLTRNPGLASYPLAP